MRPIRSARRPASSDARPEADSLAPGADGLDDRWSVFRVVLEGVSCREPDGSRSIASPDVCRPVDLRMERADRAEGAPQRDARRNDSPAHLVAELAHMRQMTPVTHHPFDDPRRPIVMPLIFDRPRLLFALGEADCLDIVTVGIQHERAVVRRTVLRSRTGPAVVAPAGLHRRFVEFAYGSSILRQNRHVRKAVRDAFAVPDPDPLLIRSCEARAFIVAEDERVSERCERRLIESLAPLEIRNSEA